MSEVNSQNESFLLARRDASEVLGISLPTMKVVRNSLLHLRIMDRTVRYPKPWLETAREAVQAQGRPFAKASAREFAATALARNETDATIQHFEALVDDAIDEDRLTVTAVSKLLAVNPITVHDWRRDDGLPMLPAEDDREAGLALETFMTICEWQPPLQD